MPSSNYFFAIAFMLSMAGLSSPSPAVTGDIDRAMSLGERTENKVFADRITANWLPDGKSFWYRVQRSADTQEFVLIDAESGERKSATDLESLGLPEEEPLRSSTSTVRLRSTSRTGVSSAVKFDNQLDTDVDIFWINQQGEHQPYGRVRANTEREQHTYEGHVWLVTSQTGEHLAVIEAAATLQTLIIDGQGTEVTRERRRGRRPGRSAESPDGKWSAFVDDGLVKLRCRETQEVRHLATDLDGHSPYRGGISWAPDSSAFVVSNTPDYEQRRVTVVNTSPTDQLQPKLFEYDYPKPGDPLPQPCPVIFRLHDDGHDSQCINDTLFDNPFTQSDRLNIRWSVDGSEFYFDYNQRGHQIYRIIAVNTETGDVRSVVEETSDTFIDYRSKTWRHWLDETGELLWMSERDGWCHLWLVDVETGEAKNQVTNGNWPVRRVLHVDEENREVWFLASGLNSQEDPYHQHLCRVKFDGSDLKQLTESDGQHRIEFSPNRNYFIAAWSRVDQPPVHELRRSDDGSLVCVLEEADASALLASGWNMPERFVAKGRDGETDIHGIVIKPTHFDPNRRYPVVEEIYAGPHSAFVPKEFGRLLRQSQIAELGFIVVQIDGMGTNHRGKAFHDVCWKNLKDAGFSDRVAWIRSAAAERPWMDLSRVGIYGGSAGGQSAMRALLDYNDFYHVAVADCGCHDNRMDKVWWNEQWLGWPVDESYAANSNAEDAHKLRGKLLLIVGELDNNVDPASTMQVVGALQKANKSFDFMPIIGTGHGAAERPYGSRLRMEFLVRHLQP